MESNSEKEYRDEIFKKPQDYPNLYELETKKNRWRFKNSFNKVRQ